DDGIERDPAEIDARTRRGDHLAHDVAQPARAPLAPAASLSDDDGMAGIALRHLQEHLAKRLAPRVVVGERGAPAVLPLPTEVVVDADDVEVGVVAAQLRPGFAGEHIPRL